MYIITVPITTYPTTPTRIVKMQLVKGLGIEDPCLWKICPKEYRHLLHDERRQELNKSVKKQYIKTLKIFFYVQY